MKERPICWVLGKWFSPQPNIGDVNLDNLGQASQDERRNVGSPPLLADLSLLNVECYKVVVAGGAEVQQSALRALAITRAQPCCVCPGLAWPGLSPRENANLLHLQLQPT